MDNRSLTMSCRKGGTSFWWLCKLMRIRNLLGVRIRISPDHRLCSSRHLRVQAAATIGTVDRRNQQLPIWRYSLGRRTLPDFTAGRLPIWSPGSGCSVMRKRLPGTVLFKHWAVFENQDPTWIRLKLCRVSGCIRDILGPDRAKLTGGKQGIS